MLTINEIQQLDDLTPQERYEYILKVNTRLNRRVYEHNLFRFFTGKPRALRYSLIDMIVQYDQESPYNAFKEQLKEAQACEGWSPSLKDIPDNI